MPARVRGGAGGGCHGRNLSGTHACPALPRRVGAHIGARLDAGKRPDLRVDDTAHSGDRGQSA